TRRPRAAARSAGSGAARPRAPARPDRPGSRCRIRRRCPWREARDRSVRAARGRASMWTTAGCGGTVAGRRPESESEPDTTTVTAGHASAPPLQGATGPTHVRPVSDHDVHDLRGADDHLAHRLPLEQLLDPVLGHDGGLEVLGGDLGVDLDPVTDLALDLDDAGDLIGLQQL